MCRADAKAGLSEPTLRPRADIEPRVEPSRKGTGPRWDNSQRRGNVGIGTRS